METLKELQETIGAVDGVRESNRGSPLTKHLTTVSEGIPMLGWVTIDPKPTEYVTEMLNASKYHGNRVYKEAKEKWVEPFLCNLTQTDQAISREPSHIEWLQAYYAIFQSLISYIKEHYPNGLTWNNKDGIDASEALRQVETSSSPKPASGPSAPPPPPPLPSFDSAPPPPPMPNSSTRAPAGDMNDVFNQLSKGEAVTAGLRKVSPSQQTHKNPSLRTNTVVPPIRSDSLSSTSSAAARGKSPLPARKPESMRTKKPPRKALDGNKWIIEHFDSPSETVTIEASINQSVLVTRCSKLTLQIVGKANAVSIDSSSAVSLIIDSLVSAVDVIKTPRFEMQVLGTLPTVMLDQVDGAAIYLGQESLGTEVFTSKCTAVNVCVQGAGTGEEGDYRECPVPEQIKTVVRGGVVVSEIVEHAG